ncbi:MAG TPA: hypothetical protein VFP54_05075 [Acidimicrobiales bacterium]|nr:hypothetical protein [Acidimicrobiales bacterium]
MAVGALDLEQERRGIRPANLRVDRWWLGPTITVAVLGAFVVYSTWSAFTPHGFLAVSPHTGGNRLLSPLFSPCITSHCGPGNNGTTWHLLSWWPFSAAFLVLPFPLLLRGTCYYYRRAYYRSFWGSPPACAVPDVHRSYSGESKAPLIIQNIHRYGWYLALPFPIILLWEAIKSFAFHPGIGMSLGSLILLVNAVLLAGYTMGCHSGRHVCGGHLNAFSKGPARYWLWKRINFLNDRHMLLAWVSLIFVAFTDGYVRLVQAGVFSDPRFF